MIDQEKIRFMATRLRAMDLTTCAEAADAIDLLLADLEAAAADKRDAERYRWLRDKANFAKGWAPMVFNCEAGEEISWQSALHDGWLDDAIDAAIAQQ